MNWAALLNLLGMVLHSSAHTDTQKADALSHALDVAGSVLEGGAIVAAAVTTPPAPVNSALFTATNTAANPAA